MTNDDLKALVERLHDDDPWFDSRDRREAADAIERLEAEVVALREALERIATSQPRPKRNGDYDRHDLHNLKILARAALEKRHD